MPDYSPIFCIAEVMILLAITGLVYLIFGVAPRASGRRRRTFRILGLLGLICLVPLLAAVMMVLP
jgi:hypothetical protein